MASQASYKYRRACVRARAKFGRAIATATRLIKTPHASPSRGMRGGGETQAEAKLEPPRTMLMRERTGKTLLNFKTHRLRCSAKNIIQTKSISTKIICPVPALTSTSPTHSRVRPPRSRRAALTPVPLPDSDRPPGSALRRYGTSPECLAARPPRDVAHDIARNVARRGRQATTTPTRTRGTSSGTASASPAAGSRSSCAPSPSSRAGRSSR